MSTTTKSDRRRFLIQSSTAVVGAGTAAIAIEGCNNAPCPPRADADVGLTVADVAMNTCRTDPNGELIICRDANGFYAYCAICTHLACAIPAPASPSGTSECPCHNAVFNGNGDNVRPADGLTTQASLAHYPIGFIGTGSTARIVVNTTMPVDRALRYNPT